jgi:hypothetical protein
MASRAILAETIQSATGDVQGSTAVTVLETDGATPIGQVMYAAPTGGATLTNPLTTTTAGRVVAYATTAQRCKLRIGTAVYEAEFRPDPADILSSTNTALLTPTLTAPTVADYVRFTEQGSAPTSPDATHSDLYVGSDGNLYVLNDSGVPIRVILAGQAAIVNGDVAAGAAIALSKLAPGSAGLVRSNGTVLSAGNTITDTDVANGAGIAASKLATAGLAPSLAIANGYLAASVAGNALTIAIKTLADADPSASDQVTVAFRNATAGTGTYTPILLQSATSIVVSSGSTLGTANATAFRIWIVAFNDAGTLRLGVINCLSGTSIFPLAGWGIASSTAEGGSGAADSPQVFYSGVGVASKPYVVLGYATYETGLATAGTWTAVPSRLQMMEEGTPLPGAVVQRQRTASGAVATGTTVLPWDDTIPQSTEGDQYLSQAITPTSAANLLEIEALLNLSPAGANNMTAALFQDATANALAANTISTAAATASTLVPIRHVLLAALTTATTFKVRAGGNAAGTTTFNGVASGRLFGGVIGSFLEAREVMR